jgi:hypothetical protein
MIFIKRPRRNLSPGRWRHCALALLILIVGIGSGSATALAKSSYSEFSGAWKDRADRYAAQHAELDQKARKAVVDFDAVARIPNSPELAARVREMWAAIQAVGYNEGRGAALFELRTLMEKHPSPGRIDVWMQEQVERVQSAGRDATAQIESVHHTTIGQNGVTAIQYLTQAENAYRADAQAAGTADELKLIQENLASYYQERGQEQAVREARRRALAQSLAAVGQAFRDAAPPPSTSWHATCTQFGTTTHCNGN